MGTSASFPGLATWESPLCFDITEIRAYELGNFAVWLAPPAISAARRALLELAVLHHTAGTFPRAPRTTCGPLTDPLSKLEALVDWCCRDRAILRLGSLAHSRPLPLASIRSMNFTSQHTHTQMAVRMEMLTFKQAFENTSTNVAAAQMRNALTALAETVEDPAQKKVRYISTPSV